VEKSSATLYIGNCEDANNNVLYDKCFATGICFTTLQLSPTADEKVNNDQRPITDHYFSHVHKGFWLETQIRLS